MPSMQVLLPIGALAFYVVDSSMLLDDDEVVLVRMRQGWQIHDGWGLTLRNRRPWIPNPLRPDRITIRQRWSVADMETGVADGEILDKLDRHLLPVKFIVAWLLVLLLSALPVASVVFGAGAFLLGVFAATYISVVTAVVIVYSKRQVLGLTPRGFWLLALDVFACPPFAINLVRKLSVRYGLPCGLVTFATSQREESLRVRTTSIVKDRLTLRLALEEPGSTGHEALRQALVRLEARPS